MLGLLTLAAAAGVGQARSSSSNRSTHLSSADSKVLGQATELYDRGDLKGAEPLLRDLSERNPSNFEVIETLGGLYAEVGEAERALPLLQRAARLAPGQAIAHANLGAVYLKLKRAMDAVTELKRAAALEPRNADSLSALGQAYMTAGKPAEAAAAFSEAVALKPQDADTRYNLALAYFEEGSLKSAGDALAAIPATAQTDQVHSLAGDVDEKLGRYEDAVKEYQAAATLNASEVNTYALGIELLRHWTFAPAIEVFQFGSTRYPESDRLRLGEGIAYYGNSDYKAAIPIFLKLLERSPEDERVADLLGRSCSAVGAGESTGCDGLTGFALKHPRNAWASVFAAITILHQPAGEQNTVLAEQLLRAAISADAKIPEAHYQLAALQQERGQWSESMRELEQAIALRPTYAEAHYRLSRAYAHVGRRDEAQQQIALQQRYSQQDKDEINQRLRAVVTFLTAPN